MKRPSLIDDRVLLLPPRLLGCIDYYRVAARYARVAVDPDVRFNKRTKEVHRFDIVDTRGLLRLTVPVAKPERPLSARWSDITVSTHNEWWNALVTSLESAYGRTPFFEFYIDRFLPFFGPRTEGKCESVTTLDDSLHRVVCDILGLPAPLTVADALATNLPVDDLRCQPLPALPPMQPYYQVRADRLGFHPGLSIIDLIFNLGPEAAVKIYILDNR